MSPAAHLRAAVLGSPIAHSLSPALHRAAYAQLGLADWSYDRIECAEDAFGSWFAGARSDPGWAGLSLTMPLKRVVLPLLDTVSPLARGVGAVNTVVFPSAPGSDGAGVHGENTDVQGIVAALAEIGVTEASDAVVLGGGATAASALAALGRLGCASPVLLVRSAARAGDALEAGRRLGLSPVVRALDDAPAHLDAGVWISTLPGTAGDAVAERVAVRIGGGSSADADGGALLPALLDVTYAPWPTGLGRLWQGRGAAVVGGLSMLVHQAAAQVRLMTGRAPDAEGMRAAALAEMDRRRSDVPVVTAVPPVPPGTV